MPTAVAAAKATIEKGGVLTLAGKGSAGGTSKSELDLGVNASVVNAGTIAIGDGKLTISQSMTPSSTGSLTNTGLITIGQYADVRTGGGGEINGPIYNYDATSKIAGTIEVDGRVAKGAAGSLNSFLGKINDTGSGGNIGNVVITNAISELNSAIPLPPLPAVCSQFPIRKTIPGTPPASPLMLEEPT